MLKHLLILSFFSMLWPAFSQPDMTKSAVFVDSIFQAMTLDQKIGQLFMVRAFSKDDTEHIAFVKKQLANYHVGGICFFQGSPDRQAQLTNAYQKLSELPLFIGIDAEWGLGMRFIDKAISFPKNMTIGAINDHQLIYRMGEEIGRQLRLLGVNINFAPVLDVNNNPDNPVINVRSFGENKVNVASKSYAIMKGMESEGVMACGKHFPGHGDTATDSHHDLPIIPFSRERLDSLELFPFKILIKQGIQAIMVAHLQVPSLESREDRASTVSNNIVQGLLREELGFQGLIFTDAMEMKAVTKHFPPGKADLESFLAGNDIILLPEDIHMAFNSIKTAVLDSTISSARLEESVKRILYQKFRLGLFAPDDVVKSYNISQEVNSVKAQVIKSQIFEKSITLVKDKNQLIPLKELSGVNFASIALGADRLTPFQQRILSYVSCDNYWLSKDAESAEYALKETQLSKKDIVFISIHNMSRYSSRQFGINSDQIAFIKSLAEKTKVVLVIFGSPYALTYFESLNHLLVAYEEDDVVQDAAAQALFGSIDITGKLPVSAGKHFRAGTGLIVPGIRRLGFAIPESVGLNSDTLRRIRMIVDEMIRKKAAPGCQILVAKDNKVVYWKSFGSHTYNNERRVESGDLYDLASITKIMATTISVMHLEDQHQFDLKQPVSRYIPSEDTTNKANIIYEDIMAHVGKLKPWIPFYLPTLTKGRYPRPDDKYYKSQPCDEYSLRVSPDLYLRNDYRDTIYRRVFSSPLREKDSYRYSDLAFYILNKTLNNVSGMDLDDYGTAYFYNPLGLRTTTFNPLDHFSKDQIVPSEVDDYYRMTTIHGTVHDMGAAMLNGVSGHAGLFSNAFDLAVIMQMLLNDGQYGGRQYLNPETIKRYTNRHWRSSRRGIGFDMKELNPNRSMNMSEKASRHTFGHLGFTGTAVFGDPQHKIVFVFLSNRTFPSMENNKLGKNNYRPRIQTIVYNALMDL